MDKIIFEKVGDRLRKARELNSITLEEAGRKVDVHKSTVLRWENGETAKIKLPVLETLANFYNVNPVWLMGYDVEMHVHGVGNANYDSDDFFTFKISDNSMQPILYEGDIVIVHKQDDVLDGEFAVVSVNNEAANVRKVIKHDDFIELGAFNSYYPIRHVGKENSFSILGKVVEGRISQIFNL